MDRTISNMDDIIDSRDVRKRIEELRDEIEAYDEERLERMATDADEMGAERVELAALEALADEAAGCGDWEYGETLIRDSYFERYAEELANDIGAINADATWPNSCIDWERAANELKQDYTSVEFGDVTYWLRS